MATGEQMELGLPGSQNLPTHGGKHQYLGRLSSGRPDWVQFDSLSEWKHKNLLTTYSRAPATHWAAKHSPIPINNKKEKKEKEGKPMSQFSHGYRYLTGTPP